MLMKSLTSSVVPLLFAALPLVTPAVAQPHVLASDSKLWVEGTSNKSDWAVSATEFEVEASLAGDGHIEAMVLKVPADKIVSNQSTIMDRLMHKTLKVTQHPVIEFELVALEPLEGDSLQAVGNLTIAGVTNEASFGLTRVEAENGGKRYIGAHSMKMTDYGMKPPSAMFGALHTGDDVTVHFDMAFVPGQTDS